MPATDPADQHAARSIESSLRDAVRRHERPPVELEWFAALPKRVRRSGQLIEAALVEAKVLLDHIRADWINARRVEKEREERLAKANSQPRNIECLRAPDPTGWNGLGRRKKRCRAFDAVGRAYNARQQVSKRAPVPSNAPVDVQTLQPTGGALPRRPSTTLGPQHMSSSPASTESSIPSPSPTPPGLREAVESLRHLVRRKNPYMAPTKSEVHSPDPNYVPEAPPPPPCTMQSFQVQNPFFETRELWFSSLNCHIDGPLLTAMSYGKVASVPWEKPHSLDDLAVLVVEAHHQDPGGLDILTEALFPGGIFAFSSARVPTKAAQLVIEGWLWMMEEHITGRVPQVQSLCQCGGVLKANTCL